MRTLDVLASSFDKTDISLESALINRCRCVPQGFSTSTDSLWYLLQLDDVE